MFFFKLLLLNEELKSMAPVCKYFIIYFAVKPAKQFPVQSYRDALFHVLLQVYDNTCFSSTYDYILFLISTYLVIFKAFGNFGAIRTCIANLGVGGGKELFIAENKMQPNERSEVRMCGILSTVLSGYARTAIRLSRKS